MKNSESLESVDRELYIFLGDLCNFECSHCICNSSPKANKYRLSREEIYNLCQYINSRDEIQWVHFTGGEPSLLKAEIVLIQGLVSRNVRYAMTTNGWFGGNFDRILSGVQLDRVHISHDKFHGKFTSSKKIDDLITELKKRKIETKVNTVYDDLTDLSYPSNLADKDFSVSGRKLVKGGRQRSNRKTSFSLKQNNLPDTYCYSFEPNEFADERIIYIPGKGLTPCCGPLVFDELAVEEFIFSDLSENIESNGLYKAVKHRTFKEALRAKGMVANSCAESRCDLCVQAHGEKISEGKSVRSV